MLSVIAEPNRRLSQRPQTVFAQRRFVAMLVNGSLPETCEAGICQLLTLLNPRPFPEEKRVWE